MSLLYHYYRVGGDPKVYGLRLHKGEYNGNEGGT